MSSQDVELGPVYTGDATVELFDVPGDELSSLRPYEMIAGYWRQVGASVHRWDQARMRLVRFRYGDRIATGAIDTGSDDIRVLRGTFFEDPIPTGEQVPLADVRSAGPRAALQGRLRGQELRGARRGVRHGGSG